MKLDKANSRIEHDISPPLGAAVTIPVDGAAGVVVYVGASAFTTWDGGRPTWARGIRTGARSGVMGAGWRLRGVPVDDPIKSAARRACAALQHGPGISPDICACEAIEREMRLVVIDIDRQWSKECDAAVRRAEEAERCRHTDPDGIQRCDKLAEFCEHHAQLDRDRLAARVKELEPMEAMTTFAEYQEQRERADKAEKALAHLREAVNDNDPDCDPECGSHGHTPACPKCDPAAWLTMQQEKLAHARKNWETTINLHNSAVAEIKDQKMELRRLAALLQDVAACGVEYENKQHNGLTRYHVVQIDDGTWRRVQETVQENRRRALGGEEETGGK